jgi:hypothetical protein
MMHGLMRWKCAKSAMLVFLKGRHLLMMVKEMGKCEKGL